LRGDTRKAKAWIPWAAKQLDRLKHLMAGQPVSTVLRPVNGTAVYVRSVNDIDFIRIVVAKLLEAEDPCTADFTTIISGLNASFTSTLGGLANATFWDFGDGQFESTVWDANPSHTYSEAGTYNVTLRGYQWKSGAPSPSPLTGTFERRDDAASAVSHADSYSKWINLNWIVGGDRSQFLATGGGGVWRTFGGKMIVTFPLQDIASHPDVIAKTSIIYVTGRWLTYIVIGNSLTPIIKKISGSDLGLNVRLASTMANDNVAGIIPSSTPMIESSIQFIDASDVEPWTIIPDDPAVYGSNTGWTGLFGALLGAAVHVIPYDCIALKTKQVTVA
jgi:hypothetical protein